MHQISTAIIYKDVYDDYNKVDIILLLKGIPSITALKVVCHFMAQIHTIETDSSKQKYFFEKWISRLPLATQKRVVEFVLKVLKSRNTDYNFLNNTSSLILIEYLLENYDAANATEKLTLENEEALFKAYLWCSQQWVEKANNLVKGISQDLGADDLIKIVLPLQLPYGELLERQDFRIQFLKSVYFFKFCESNSDFKGYLAIFLKEYGIKNWQTYLFNLLSLYVKRFGLKGEFPSILNVQDQFPAILSFLENFCLDVNKFKRSDDFTNLRNHPILKLSNNEFLFLNINFLIDKIFQGIQFDFGRVLSKHQAEYNGKIIKSFDQFKSLYGSLFSELTLFYETINYCFEETDYVIFKGEDLKNSLKDAEPDFYMRDKAKIYLFEYKDILLNAKVKHSYDFNVIQQELRSKLVENRTGAAKGVTQLVSTIENILKGDFKKVDNFDAKNVIIYPILVCNDFTFYIRGINYILNKEFQKQIMNKGIRGVNIKGLVIVNLDTLIKFQDLFRKKKLKLNNCINEFYEYLRGQSLWDRTGTFDIYLHKKTQNMSYDTPEMMLEEINKMVPEVLNEDEAANFWLDT